MLRLKCQACSKAVGVDDSLVGKKVKCPHCGEMIAIPRTSKEETSQEPTEKGGRTLLPERPEARRVLRTKGSCPQ